jgi:WD40 repeat protein
VGGPTAGVYVGSLDNKPDEQQKIRILNVDTTTVYSNGKLFFFRDDTLMVQDFDADKLQLSGAPIPVVERLDRVNVSVMFAVSPSGVMAYRQRPKGGVLPDRRITAWYDRAGKQTSSLEVQNQDGQFRLSPDGRSAVSRAWKPDNTPDGLWLNDFVRAVRTPLTFQQPGAQHAVWSPDGTRVYYDDADEVYQKDANGAGVAKRLWQASSPVSSSSVSPSGKFLVVSALQPDGISLLPLSGEPKPISLLQSPADEGFGAFSPNGQWLAYYSNESGRNEVYVRPFLENGPKGPALGEGKWRISRNGATVQASQPPQWTKDGREIVFRSGSEYHAVAVSASGGVFQVGQDTTLFTLASQTWDVSADGEKFLISTNTSAASPAPQAPITVVLNWEAEFKK